MPKRNHASYQIDLLKTPAPNFTNEQVKDFIQKMYGLTGTLSPLDSERDQNLHLQASTGDQFVIKIANSAEDPEIIDMQIKALEHIAITDPTLPVPEVLYSRNGLALEHMQGEGDIKHTVRILTYLQGAYPKDHNSNLALNRQVGICLGRSARALRGFFHPAANYQLMWDLKNTPNLKQYLVHIADPGHYELVSYFLDRFDQNVLPEIPKLRAQVVHNDLCPDNILVAENDPGRITGIIDFGDLVHTLLVIDLATSIAAMLRGQSKLVEAAAEIVAGYHEIIPLEADELRILYDLIAARMTMLSVIALWRVTIHPENREYITGGVEKNWQALSAWRDLDPAEVTKRFFRACNLWEKSEPGTQPQLPNETTRDHLARRERLLGPCAYLFYSRPLHIVHGKGVWLYDAEGNRYLDAYNNVSHIGHGHPHVVNAITKQGRRLNTSTRYMHGLILELAEQITSRLPEPLSVCMFVCTGSEANELAWRMAQLVSGNSGALISRYSYHGSTFAMSRLSTETISESKLPSNVKTFMAPTSDTTFFAPDSGINSAMMALNEHGHNPAMLIADTAWVSDGIFTSPVGYLEMLKSRTQSAGGLFVADEVQVGFGRFGEHFFGFQFNDVVPDFVTMGKPMGNGHPIAAVVTRPEIAEALAEESGYFNTFGGNPVSCAAGLAVLEVIEKESLQQNALEVGQYLRQRLVSLQKSVPAIGEIHGSGLLQGVDVIHPDGSPDSDLADRIMNQMRENGVLVGITGPHSATLKIRPPMVFQKEHVDILISVLESELTFG